MGEWNEDRAERARFIVEAFIAGLLVLFAAYAAILLLGALQ
jgi:hypothetical protein